MELQVYQEKHPMRHFSIPEIALLADLTNFTVIKTEEFGTQEKPSENTKTCCCYKKNNICTIQYQ